MLSDSLIDGDARSVLVIPGKGVFSGDALRRWLRSHSVSEWASGLAGRRVALHFTDNFALALSLFVLDGVAESLVLLPGDASDEVLRMLTERSGATVLVGDGEPFSGAPVFASPPMWAEPDEGPVSWIRPGGVVTEWILTTSGTTRTPKLAVHTLASLTHSVKRDRERGELTVWGLLYDLNRFAGLQVFLQAILGGSTLVIPPKGLSPGDRVAVFSKAGCNALSATPTLWRKLLMTPGADALMLRQVTLGGEIADRAVLAALAKRFPSARVVHIYASTETGVGFAVSDGREGFPAAWLRTGIGATELRVSQDGILEVRSGAGCRRYLGETTPLSGDDGFIRTGDCVRVDGDRVLFLGRDSGAINVGGDKVRPEEVERVLLAHPWVAFASVGAKRSGITGALVEARVVLSSACPDASSAVATLLEWCAARLDRHKVPALLRVVPSLEINATGKISRQ